MCTAIEYLAEIAPRYQAIVFDQWGVLHNGSSAYPGAIEALASLSQRGNTRLCVLSNSGKRAEINAQRIRQMGFSTAFELVMTSGEALWCDAPQGRCFYAIERDQGDASVWAQGLDISLTADINTAQAVLLMGLPDGEHEDAIAALARAEALSLPVYCSNPDRASPRAEGLVVSPGELAHRYQARGGEVFFYGKPHLPVFTAVQKTLGVERLLMVGDSLEHDIAGAHAAGWDSVLVQGGLYAQAFAESRTSTNSDAVLRELARAAHSPLPTYHIPILQ